MGALISGLYLDDGKAENIVEHLRLFGYKMRTSAQNLESHCKIESWFFSLVYAEISERWPAFLEQMLKNESTWYCSKIQKVSIHQPGWPVRHASVFFSAASRYTQVEMQRAVSVDWWSAKANFIKFEDIEGILQLATLWLKWTAWIRYGHEKKFQNGPMD